MGEDEKGDSTYGTKPSAFLGQQVTVTLGEEDGAQIIAEGLLLGWGTYGEFQIQMEDGSVHYCWPLLSIRGSSDG